MTSIRRATTDDFAAMQAIFRAVIASGDSYVFAEPVSEQDIHDYWFGPGIAAFLAVEDGRTLGMYKLLANQRDRGAHVANAAFMIAPQAQGRGVGRVLGEHCLQQARDAGFQAMQFNFVVASNEAAVRLWQSLGFHIVGTLPGAFRHAQLGDVDVHVMYRGL